MEILITMKRDKMFKQIVLIIGWMMISIVLIGCSPGNNDVRASLGQEFSLKVNQTVAISEEDISVKFDKVLTDSRCPIGVVCVWAGEARCLTYFNAIGSNTAPEAVELIEQGGQVNGYSQATWKSQTATYRINFRLDPYPEAEKQINNSDYRLIMVVTK